MVGLPVAGVDVKLAPVNDKLELRLQGDCITPGYWKDAALTAAALDDEGYFCLGDAVTLVDPDRPESGMRFDGRLAENFKLSSGPWVHVGSLRSAVITALVPLATDVVLAGSGREFVAALVFPDLAACRRLDPALAPDAHAYCVVASSLVRQHFQQRLDALAAAGTGSASRVLRMSIEAEPATLDSGEMTPKFALSAAAVLRLRASTVDELFTEPPSPRVLAAHSD